MNTTGTASRKEQEMEHPYHEGCTGLSMVACKCECHEGRCDPEQSGREIGATRADGTRTTITLRMAR